VYFSDEKMQYHSQIFARKPGICNGAEASLPWKLLRTYLESCANIVQPVVCRPLLLPLLLSRLNPSPDAVRSRNLSKSTLTHDAVPAVVSHKHHSIIRIGAGLIQFVDHGAYPLQKSIFAIFRASIIHKRTIFAIFRASFTTARPYESCKNI